jgi:hypothetical protein
MKHYELTQLMLLSHIHIPGVSSSVSILVMLRRKLLLTGQWSGSVYPSSFKLSIQRRQMSRHTSEAHVKCATFYIYHR